MGVGLSGLLLEDFGVSGVTWWRGIVRGPIVDTVVVGRVVVPGSTTITTTRVYIPRLGLLLRN